MTRADAEVLLIALGWAGGVGVLGLFALRGWRGRSIRAALVSVTLLGVLSVTAGVVGTARAMFISTHDLGVVLPVSVVAGAVGVLVAVLLGTGVVRDVEAVRASARALGTPLGRAPAGHSRLGTAGPQTRPPRPTVRELAEIADELDATSTRLADARTREQALEASRRELVAWVSHDLRTPLAGLRAMAEALEDGVATDPTRYHRQIRREVDRLAAMVDDLFELSRIQAGSLTLARQAVDLRELVDDVLAGSLPMAEAGGVRLGGEAAPAAVRGDPAELGRVLANLVVNAIRHTPSDGAVLVEAGVDGGHAVLSVSDACGGLREEELARVFDAGWRGSAARTPVRDGAVHDSAVPGGGAGLGLAIARGIVEAHDGRIDVHNTASGCRFEIRLPRLTTH